MKDEPQKRRLSALFTEQLDEEASAKHCVHNIFHQRKIVLYGAGNGFITFKKFVLDRYGYQPTLILDSKFDGKDEFDGIPASSPNEYQLPLGTADEVVVVITIGDATLFPSIRTDLRSIGFHRIIYANDIYQYHLHYTSHQIEKSGREFFLRNGARINEAYDLLSDDESREVFTSILATHMRKRLHRIPSHPLNEQYFPRDVPLSKGYDRVINCGSFDGDTVRVLNRHHGKIEFLACFEPDSDNYRRLTSFLESKVDKIAETVVSLPVGVYSQTCSLRFGGGKSTNSSLDQAGQGVIQCVAIDDALPKCRPSFINMDIEGAEPDALIGCKNTIREHQPDLAICVYHSIEHLWEMPLQLAHVNSRYRYYLRNYTGFVAETVLYATEFGDLVKQ